MVRQITFVNIKKMLNDMQETLPYDATFQAITLLSSVADKLRGTTVDNLLITTGRYNTIQLELVWNAASKLLSSTIKRMYLRYSYYEIANHISHTNDLFLIKNQLPLEFDQGNQTKQLYTIYSTREDSSKGL